MPTTSARRNSLWWVLLAAIIVAGVLSRVGHTGFRIVDKYLGDALYAAMVYVFFRLTNRVSRVALWASATMLAIELFQLTGIAARMFRSGNAVLRVGARLMGTEFSLLDLVAYAVGIVGCIAANATEEVARRRKSAPL